MKFSICSIWQKAKKLEEIVDFATSINLDGVEIWDEHIDDYLSRNNCGIHQLKAYLDQHNLACCGITAYFNFLAIDKAEASIVCAKKCIDYADGLGAPQIRTFVGDKPSSDVSKSEWELIISSLKKMAKMAEGHDVKFALETHYGQPTDRAQKVIEILKSVGSDRLAVLFDGFNFFVDGISIIEEYKTLKPYIIHHHVKNYYWEKRECATLESGDANFRPMFLEMAADGYDGFASFEYFCEDPREFILESINWIKEL